MDNALRDDLADRAFLFDDPDAYMAGVDAALQGLGELDTDDKQARQQRSSAPQR